jgi:HlyD family secretion protein
MLFEITELKDSTSLWLPSMRRHSFVIYWLVIGLFLAGLLSMFLIHVDVSIVANGIIQPLNERNENGSYDSLIGECYVLSKDIVFIKKGQTVRLQIDAFNYNYFGVVTGSIFSIDDDFILVDKNPVLKVKCRLNVKELKLPNGYIGEIKKGMRFRARCITCNRTLWQLLYDGLCDWLDTSRQSTSKNKSADEESHFS